MEAIIINTKLIQLFYDVLRNLEDVNSEEQIQFLSEHSDHINLCTTDQFQICRYLQKLNPEAQKYLINSVLVNQLRSLIRSSSELSFLVANMCSGLQKDVIAIIGIDFIIGLFQSTNSFTYTFLYKHPMHEFLINLLSLSPEIIWSIERKVDSNRSILQESFDGCYDIASLQQYLSDLAAVLSRYSCTLIKLNSVILKYDSSGWTLVDKNASPPILQSKLPAQIAKAIAKLIGLDNELVRITTTIEVMYVNSIDTREDPKRALEYIADKQLCSLVRFWHPEQKRALFQKAALQEKTLICQALINQGYNFYSHPESEKIEKDFYNSLCELQAKYNVRQLKNEILSKEWAIKVGGSTISSASGLKKVPRTVKQQWTHIQRAEEKGQTYHQAWLAIINECKQSKNRFSYFRQPAAAAFYTEIGQRAVMSLR